MPKYGSYAIRKAVFMAPRECKKCREFIGLTENLSQEDVKVFGLIQHNFITHLKAKHNIDVKAALGE